MRFLRFLSKADKKFIKDNLFECFIISINI